jgi:hypothetical protein
MGGFVEAMLGAGIGAAGAAVTNAKHDQQQLDADAAEGRIMNREAALMYLRDKYAKGQAEHADGLARGRATFENDLKLDSLNDERVTQAEGRKRQGEIDDYDVKKKIDNDYDSQKETRDNAEWGRRNGIEYGQQKGLVGMKLSAMKSRKGGGGDDDGIGNPDFVEGRKDLYSYLGIDAGGDESDMRGVIARLGLPEKASTKDAREVLKAATYVLSANPNLAPDEALQMGKDLAYKKLQVNPATLPDGRRMNYFNFNGRRYGYGRPD